VHGPCKAGGPTDSSAEKKVAEIGTYGNTKTSSSKPALEIIEIN
jgi:hypothetical protein